jgi:hypothetical protein
MRTLRIFTREQVGDRSLFRRIDPIDLFSSPIIQFESKLENLPPCILFEPTSKKIRKIQNEKESCEEKKI